MSKDNHSNSLLQEEQLQNIKEIKSKLGYLSGFIISMRSDIDNNFRELQKENQKHFRLLKNKVELYFYIMIIISLFLFIMLNFKELPFIFSFFSDQNILGFFKSLLKQ